MRNWLSTGGRCVSSNAAGLCMMLAWSASAAAQPPVIVDAGHSPAQSGATSARCVPEYAYNAALAEAIIDALHADGWSAQFAAPLGAEASLAQRVQAGASGAFFLSVHPSRLRATAIPGYLAGGRGNPRPSAIAMLDSPCSSRGHKRPRPQASPAPPRLASGCVTQASPLRATTRI
jgi:N-acetylmuramoyl-L-alanine amidase